MKTIRTDVGAPASAPMKRAPINVLFLNDHLGFEDGAIHGPARYFANVLGRFDPSAVKPKLCILRHWHPFAEELRAKGIETIFLSRRKWNPWVLADLIHLIRRDRIDLLQVAGMKGAMIGRIAAKITGIPSIIHFRDMNPQGALVGFLQRRLSGWTDAALAVSNPIRMFAINEYAIRDDRIEVLHNPVSTDFLISRPSSSDTIRAEFGLPDRAKIIAIIGRLSSEKGHKQLIEALPGLIDTFPELILLIVGDGPTRKECKLLVSELRMETAVRFAGHRYDIPAILAAVDVVTMPSVREGFPNTALESIAAGRPVVGYRVGGLPEIVIDGKTGFLVPPGDIGALAQALLKILTNSALAETMRGECLLHANRFTVANHVERLEQIYRSLLEKNQGQPGKGSIRETHQ